MPTQASPIFNILTAASILTTAGQTVESLANGQIGVFDANTGLSIVPTAANANTYKQVLIVVKNTDGTIDKNAGFTIQTPHIKYVTATCPKAGVDPVLEFVFDNVKCDSDYGIKIAVEDPQTIFMMGRSLNAKSYVIHTDCCQDEGCTDCKGPADAKEVIIKLWQAINKDTDGGKISATVVDSDNATVADPIVFAATPANAEAILKLRVTVAANPKASNGNNAVNLNYYNLRQAAVTGSYIGDGCNAAEVNLVTNTVYSVGEGYDLIEKERQALGWKGMGPIRWQAGTCLPKEARLYINPAENYKVIAIGYHNEDPVSFDTAISPNETYIALPSTVTTANANVLLGYLNFLAANNHVAPAPSLTC